MKKLLFLLLAGLIMTSLSSITLAEENRKADKSIIDEIVIEDKFTGEELVNELELEYQLWADASFTDNAEQVWQFEQNLFGLIRFDLAQNETVVRDLARQIALSPPTGDINARPPEQIAEREVLHQTFEEQLSQLNTKEMLYRALSKSDSTPYKYRLIGDYLNLLRRQLKMSKVRLAVEQVKSSSALDQASE